MILWPSCMQHTWNSFLARCFLWFRGWAAQLRRPYASHMSCRDISMEPSPLSTVWLGQLQKQLQSRSRGEAALGINLHRGKHPNNRHHRNHSNPHFGNATEWLHAPPCCLWCVDPWLGKSLWHSPLEHDYHLQTAGFFFVHRISCAILGSQNALIEVGGVLQLWPAVMAILPSLEPRQLSNISHHQPSPLATYCL